MLRASLRLVCTSPVQEPGVEIERKATSAPALSISSIDQDGVHFCSSAPA